MPSFRLTTPIPSRPALRPLPVLLALAIALLAAAGCSAPLRKQLAENQRPTVRLTYAPVDTTQREFYVYRMYWTGFDADGRVVRFEYAVDPPSDAGQDTVWVATTMTTLSFTFTASQPESIKSAQPLSRDFHVFVIRAVDNRGMRSAPAARAFYSFGVAPVVRIDNPSPSPLISPVVTPAVRISWTGLDFIDPNGYITEKPLYYKYKIFKSDADPRWSRWLSQPDSMRTTFGPAFAGWDSTGPESAYVQYTNLVPNSEYLFVVVAFGRSGAYSPIWNLSTNMLKMSVGFAAQLGPVITLYNSFFSFTYPSGGFPSPLDPSWAVQLQVPSGEPITFNWTAQPPVGSLMRRYRWVLDLVNLDDETPRTRQDDWYHWSDWNQTTTATVGPFTGAGGDTGEVHNFYIEAEDINGLVSLGWVQFRVFKPTWERNLLIVNDTRFNADQVSRTQPPGRTDSLAAPAGAWPTRAELDTFLFAVGGVRWQMTPTGTLSQPGLFAGYTYDSLGTRQGRENPTMSLSLLGQYRHVVWMVDASGSRYDTAPTSATLPMTTLRYMSMRNRQNTLATWVNQGGDLWALGGGFGNAVTAYWNVGANDLNGVRTYTSLTNALAPVADLLPGRFMYDLVHWRSEFRVFNGFIRFARLDQRDPTSSLPSAWKGRALADPRYYALPVQLQSRTPATDPLSLAPYRTNSDYYINNQAYSQVGISIEYLAYENRVLETIQVTPDSSVEYSALDTLYNAYAPAYPGQLLQPGQGVNALMTYYKGGENGSVMFLGSSIWDHRRTHCQGLVDFVLGQMWGMTRNTVASSPSPARTARPAVTAAATGGRLAAIGTGPYLHAVQARGPAGGRPGPAPGRQPENPPRPRSGSR